MLIGIVGKPNCGKSTFFKAATLADVEIANYPFTTIKPNHGMGFVRVDDAAKEFGKVSQPRLGYVLEGMRFVPVDLLDVAGLVPDAHKGEGMGGEFLNDLNQAHVLVHVIDISGSTNQKGESVPALSYDPLNDVRFLERELDYWYLGIIKKGWEKFARTIMQEKKQVHVALGKQLGGLRVTEKMVEEGIVSCKLDPERPASWSEDDLLVLATYLRRRSKPMMIAANKIDVAGAEKNYERMKKEFPEYKVVGCSAEAEVALKEAGKHGLIGYVPGTATFSIKEEEKLNERQKKALEFIKTSVLDKYGTTGVQDVINAAVFDVLKYIAAFPGGVGHLEDSEGKILPDCFLVPSGTTALDFAFAVHTDLGKGFIRALDMRTKRAVGKEYVLKHSDVIEIISSK